MLSCLDNGSRTLIQPEPQSDVRDTCAWTCVHAHWHADMPKNKFTTMRVPMCTGRMTMQTVTRTTPMTMTMRTTSANKGVPCGAVKIGLACKAELSFRSIKINSGFEEERVKNPSQVATCQPQHAVLRAPYFLPFHVRVHARVGVCAPCS